MADSDYLADKVAMAMGICHSALVARVDSQLIRHGPLSELGHETVEHRYSNVRAESKYERR